MPIKASNLNSNQIKNEEQSVNVDQQQQMNSKNGINLKSNSGANEKFSRHEGGEQQITVACRIRPLTEEEIREGSSYIGHKIADDNMIVLMDPMEDHDDVLRANRSREKQFVFDMVFDAKSTQQDVYEKTTKSLLPGVLNGYNATVFAYGATGAGKTYTMLGTEQEPGIMFRTLHDLFIEISKTSNSLMYQVSMSYLEIYNELIRDLLSPSNGFLELREDAKGGVQVAGISELVAETPQEVMHMLHKGNKERTQEPTKANKTSSRSHAVLQVNIKQRDKVRSHNQEIRLGKLYMIDLAGSERAAQTQNTGKRMVEGAHINRSLLALGNCINALSEKGSSKYVNYRDSKLTRILKDSLGGNSKTVMIAHISPASIHFEESRNTLVYADRAKYIRTKLRRNVIDVSYHISQYQQIIQELAQEIAILKDQRYDLESRVSHLDQRSSLIGLNQIGNGIEDKSKIEEHLKLRESLLQAFKQQIKLRKNILELDNAVMDLNIETERHHKIIDSWYTRKESDPNKSETPEAVLNSKEEIKVVEQDREEFELKRRDAIKELDSLRTKTKKIRDQVSKKLTTQEQKEILNLLLKNFEFEIKNVEMQADLFKRDFKIREQDMVILRLEQHRSLCDTLIHQQRKLIIDNNLIIPQDLDELFYLYSRDINDGQLMKDLSGVRSTSNSSLAGNSPKPNGANAFLTQIQEENAENSVTPTNNFKNSLQEPLSFDSTWTYARNNNELFQKTSKLTTNNSNNNSKNRKSSKEQNNFINGNYISSNGTGGLVSIGPQIPLGTKKNLSNISSSTNDSNTMEIILENPTNTSNKQLIKTNNGKVVNNKLLNNIDPPGHVEQSNNTSDAKRLTQGIAAIAAQRKASQHHRELMQELGHNDYDYNYISQIPALTPSRLAKHDQAFNSNFNTNDENLFYEKKNSFLTDGSNKTKKQVKIKDVVQYKLPDDNFYDDYLNMQNKKTNRRSSLESPLLYLKNDENKKLFKPTNKKQNYESKNIKSLNSISQPNKRINQNSLSLNNVTNVPNNNQIQTTKNNNNNNNSYNNNSPKLPPSIPNYSKGINLSLSGTSVLKN